MAPLADKCSFLKGGDEVASGVRAVDCSGHSAGLTGFQIESGGKSVLLFADSFLHYVCGIQRPDWTIGFDDDQQKAVANRKKMLAMLSAEKLMAIGFHMPFPSIGWIDKMTDGGHRWVAASYQMNV